MGRAKKVTVDPALPAPASGTALPVDHPSAPPKADYVKGFEEKYRVEQSAAASIYELMQYAGYSEKDAAAIIVPEYFSAFERGDGSAFRQSWTELATRIIRNAHPGLFQHRVLSSPGDGTRDQSGLGPQGAQAHVKACQRCGGMGYLDPAPDRDNPPGYNTVPCPVCTNKEANRATGAESGVI